MTHRRDEEHKSERVNDKALLFAQIWDAAETFNLVAHPGTGYLSKAVGQRQRHPRKHIPTIAPFETR